MKKFSDSQEVWLYPSEHAAWHFLSIDKVISKKLREENKHLSRGFGSLPVTVTIGGTTWDTSLFFDSKSERYILPLKASVRKKENIRAGDKITVSCVMRV